LQGYRYGKEYIAAQGPKPNTAFDFWRMVLQHKTESIVMLTSFVESNKVKCHEYFPKLNGRVDLDNIHIVCTAEQKFPTYTKRTLEVEKVNMSSHYKFPLIKKNQKKKQKRKEKKIKIFSFLFFACYTAIRG
jgi:protein tyrosine phosphatase